jgi:beta-carotene hydroxylase
MSDRALRPALTIPNVAWPTLVLASVALGLLVGGLAMVFAESPWLGIVTMTIATYWAFTPMHDAAHRGVSKSVALNAVIGRACALTLFGPFSAFRYVHLEHHKHTHDDAKDPDYWSGRRPAWLLPLRWVTQDLHYYAVYLRAGRPPRETVEVVLTLVAQLGIVTWLALNGQGVLALAWVVSSRLALGVLAIRSTTCPTVRTK